MLKKFTAHYGMPRVQHVSLRYSVYWMKKSIQICKDEDGLTILSSISELLFDCDFDEIQWSDALPEEQQTLELLRRHGAKMSKELA